MATVNLYKKVLDEKAEDGVSIKVCTAYKEQVVDMVKVGWKKSKSDAEKTPKTSLVKDKKSEADS